jgi:hypothetical protein
MFDSMSIIVFMAVIPRLDARVIGPPVASGPPGIGQVAHQVA